jgi:hypothetical protein
MIIPRAANLVDREDRHFYLVESAIEIVEGDTSWIRGNFYMR